MISIFGITVVLYVAILPTFKVICPATRTNPQFPRFFEFFFGRKRMKIYNFSILYQPFRIARVSFTCTPNTSLNHSRLGHDNNNQTQ